MFDVVLPWIELGGPIVLVLAVLSVYSIALVILKISQFWNSLSGAPVRDAALNAWRQGQVDEARRLVTTGRGPINSVIQAAMDGLVARWDRALLREEIERLANLQLEVLGRHLRTLEVIAAVSPLMGLLGTVLGMIESFQQLELAGGSANAAVLAAGIWKALLTTAMGLIVAIPAAVAASLLGARLDRVSHAIEDSVTRLIAIEPGVSS